MLQTYSKDQKLGSKQATEHSSNVVVSLQSKLANTSMSFKDVLEIRTEVRPPNNPKFFFPWLTNPLIPRFIEYEVFQRQARSIFTLNCRPACLLKL